MNKIILIAILSLGTPLLVNAQKHAPRYTQSHYVPGIYPEGSQRQLRVSDMGGLTSWDLKVMRNEIFARHGYIFKTNEMKYYFNQQDWYYPKFNDVGSRLTALEKKNIKFIQSYE